MKKILSHLAFACGALLLIGCATSTARADSSTFQLSPNNSGQPESLNTITATPITGGDEAGKIRANVSSAPTIFDRTSQLNKFAPQLAPLEPERTRGVRGDGSAPCRAGAASSAPARRGAGQRGRALAPAA